MMRKRILILVPTFSWLAGACQQAPDLDSYRAEILGVHQNFIDAHLAEDPSSLAEMVAQDYLFVSEGEIVELAPDDVENNLAEYFNATTFSVYKDLRDPIIGLSKDGSVAWSIVNVRVAGTRSVGQNKEEPFDTQWAWITLLERRGDEWKIIADVSTNRKFDEK